ncbi:MAG: KGK domain-containing protein [Gloeotrichia echinulata IR180]
MVDMEDGFKLLDYNDNDVVLFKDKAFKIGKVQKAIKDVFLGKFSDEISDSLSSHGVEIYPEGKLVGKSFYKNNTSWFNPGIECEILKIGSEGWRRGKFRLKVTLEFCPDEPEILQTPEIAAPESPLEDLRRQINEGN